jgi:small conductance mechanosensitive channel
MADLSAWAASLLPQVLAALLIITTGVIGARWAESALTRLLEHHQVLDLTFRGVIKALARYGILLLAIIAALQQLGVQTTSVLAAVGAILVAVGLALQGTLSNIAAGLMLLWLRPFRVGDAIETATVAGTVTDVGLFATEIRRVDGIYVFVPNSDLWSRPVTNLSRMPTRMLELRFSVRRGADLQAARERILAAAAAEALLRKDPPPTVVVGAVTEAATVLVLSAWVDTADYRRAFGGIAERVATALADL